MAYTRTEGARSASPLVAAVTKQAMRRKQTAKGKAATDADALRKRIAARQGAVRGGTVNASAKTR